MPPALELEALTKRYRHRGRMVLAGVALRVDPGEAVQVVGRNGSGKTTLLRVAAGLTRPTSGGVRRGGPTTYVPERFAPPAPMSVHRYLLHQTALQRVPRAERADAVERALVDHGLHAVADRRLGDLSKGWLQRTVVAQALVANPALVLLDEPWSGLDGSARAHLTAVLDRALAAGAAVVLTSHEAIAVSRLRRLHLVDGHLAPGPPAGPPSPPSEPTAEGRPDAGLTDPTAEGGSDGGVTERGARVVLLARRIGADADPGVVDRPGCLSHRVTPDGLEVVIDDEHGDALLAQAVQDGWTIRRVTPGPRR